MDQDKTASAAATAQSLMYSRPVEFMSAEFFLPVQSRWKDIRDDAETLEESARSIVELMAWNLRKPGSDLATNHTVAAGVAYGAVHLLDLAAEMRKVAKTKDGSK